MNTLDLSPAALIIRGSDGNIRTSTSRQEFICTDVKSGSFSITAAQRGSTSSEIISKLTRNLGAVTSGAQFVLGYFAANFSGTEADLESDAVYSIGGTNILYVSRYLMRPDESANRYQTSFNSTQGAQTIPSAACALTFRTDGATLFCDQEIYAPHFQGDPAPPSSAISITYLAFVCRFSVL